MPPWVATAAVMSCSSPRHRCVAAPTDNPAVITPTDSPTTHSTARKRKVGTVVDVVVVVAAVVDATAARADAVVAEGTTLPGARPHKTHTTTEATPTRMPMEVTVTTTTTAIRIPGTTHHSGATGRNNPLRRPSLVTRVWETKTRWSGLRR